MQKQIRVRAIKDAQERGFACRKGPPTAKMRTASEAEKPKVATEVLGPESCKFGEALG